MVDSGETKTTFETDIVEHPNTTTETDLIEFPNLRELIKISIRMSTFAQDTTVRVYEKTGGSYIQGETLTLIGRTSGANDATATATTVVDGVITVLTLADGGTGYDDAGELLTMLGVDSGATGGIGDATVVTSNVIITLVLSDGGGVYDQISEKIYPTDYETGTDSIPGTFDGDGQDMKLTLESGTVEGEIRYVSISRRDDYRQ